jgi:hypothetical protein
MNSPKKKNSETELGKSLTRVYPTITSIDQSKLPILRLRYMVDDFHALIKSGRSNI